MLLFSEVGFRIGMCGATCRVTHALQWQNKVGDQGAAALADSLKTNNCLTELNLVSEGSRGEGGCSVRLVFVLGCVAPHAV